MDENRSRYFPMYYSYIDQLKLLSNEQIGKLTMALLQNGIDGTVPKFDDAVVRMAYSFISENSRRSEYRRSEIIEKRRAAGRARAAGARKDAGGRFIPDAENQPAPASTSQHNPEKNTPEIRQKPAPASTASTASYTKDKRHSTEDILQKTFYKEQSTESLSSSDDREADDDRKILEYYRSAIGTLTAGQEKELLKAAAGLDCKKVLDAITIAHECRARSPAYVIRCIETIRQRPDRAPGCSAPEGTALRPDGILAKRAKETMAQLKAEMAVK